MKKVKCYSVRLESLRSFSEKAYKATAFDGSTCIIPKSACFGQDHDVQKSEAYWIAAWKLESDDCELQYSNKKVSFFDKNLADYTPETGVEIERHVPDEKEPVKTSIVPEFIREDKRIFVDINEAKKGDWVIAEYLGSKTCFRQIAVILNKTGDLVTIQTYGLNESNLEEKRFIYKYELSEAESLKNKHSNTESIQILDNWIKKEEVVESMKESSPEGFAISEEAIDDCLRFYENYPQYCALSAFGALVIIRSFKYGAVNVFRYENGSILFMGYFGKDYCPLAGIGDGMSVPAAFDFKSPEPFLKHIETIYGIA